MDKLRKYIQECGGDIVYSDYDKVATLEDLEYNYRYIRFILSPEAMFIKWLVENDKINYHKISDIIIYSQWRYTGVNKTTAQRVDENYLDLILMILSIQDNPIEFLISVLK